MAVAYHGSYLVWFELGRTELMRSLGCAYGALEDECSVYFPVRSVGARYLSPARYDDEVEVRTRVSRVGGATVRFEYELLRPADGVTLATGFTEHAAVGAGGSPIRLPRPIRDKLRTMEQGS